MWKKEFFKMLFSSDPSELNPKKAISLKYKNTPSVLYKYKEFNDRSLKLLKTDMMWLSKPTEFNDPFDCAFNFAAEDHWNEHLHQNLDKILNNLSQLHEFTPKEVEHLKESKRVIYDLTKILQENESYFDEMDPEKIAEAVDYIVKKEVNQYASTFEETSKKGMFISCFTETNESILMWTHYANNHKGFCIGYDFKGLGINNHITRMIFPVIYTNSIFNIDEYLKSNKKFNNIMFSFFDGLDSPLFDLSPLKDFNDKNFNNMAFCYSAINKFKDWSYEKEWRYVLPLGPELDKPLSMRVPKPKAIYLGAKTCKENCEKILKIGKNRGINVYKMNLKPSEFALESHRIYKCNDILECPKTLKK